MNIKLIKIAVFIGYSLLAIMTFGCSDAGRVSASDYPKGLVSYNDVRYYTFDPQTILSMLEMDKMEIFQPFEGDNKYVGVPVDTLGWQPSNYLKVAIALNQFAVQDDLRQWNIYKLLFTGSCANAPSGFEDAHITYFKIDEKIYATREIKLFLWNKKAVWAGGAEFSRPPIFGWKNIDMETISVGPNDAFQIAEANGGKTIRQSVENICSITMSIAPNAGFQYEDWQVEYRGSHEEPLFKIIIDPYSGLYEITP
ncbi:MAG: hypothetical protein L6461_08780 [Anaerolineae bacterium]|nr:hypothetical protein [Anaerolineae bacterium]